MWAVNSRFKSSLCIHLTVFVGQISGKTPPEQDIKARYIYIIMLLYTKRLLLKTTSGRYYKTYNKAPGHIASANARECAVSCPMM